MASASDQARQKILQRKHQEKAMEHCFENNLDDLRDIVEDAKIGLPIDPRPGEGGRRDNSLLSEAACGNAVDCLRYLLAKGADPNLAGEHGRTPLHRALYNDACDAVPVLLEAGADPRLLLPQPRDEAQPDVVVFRPWDPAEIDGVQCCPPIKAILKAWPIERTVSALAARQGAAVAAVAEQKSAQAAEAAALETSVEALAAAHAAALASYREAFALREERLLTYDTARCEGKAADHEHMRIQEALIAESEAAVTNARIRVGDAEHRLRVERAALRVVSVAIGGGLVYATEIPLSALEDTAHLAPAGRAILLADSAAGTALSLMTYRAQFVIRDLGNNHHMSPAQIRLLLLSSVRYGRTLVISLRDKPCGGAVAEVRRRFEAAQAGLWDLATTRAIAEPAHYEKWLTPEMVADHPEFHPMQFQSHMRERFVLALITAEQLPPQEVLDAFYSVKILD